MISSVSRACKILGCFSTEEPVLGITEIADKIGLNKSTTHHLITTLCKEGVLIRDISRKYRLGWKVLEWSNGVMFQQDFYEKAMPLVKGLVDSFKGTAHIAMFDNGEVINVLRISSDDSDSLPTYLGSRMPAYCTSAGKVLLAYNESYLETTIEKGLQKQGPNTITDITTLKKELEIVREQGYSISDSENTTNTFAVAAPILSYSGETIASVNLVGLPNYMARIDRKLIIQSITRMAKNLSRELGYIEV